MKQNSSIFNIFYKGRVRSSLLVGCTVTLILTVIEVLIVITVNPLSMLGNTLNRLASLFLLLAHSPLYLLLPLCELLLVSAGAFFVLRPLALYLYLRAIHREQLAFQHLYMAAGLSPAVASVHIQSLAEQPGEDLLPSFTQRQPVTLVDVLQQRNSHLFLL